MCWWHFLGHVRRHIVGFLFYWWRAWCASEKFGEEVAACVLFDDQIVFMLDMWLRLAKSSKLMFSFLLSYHRRLRPAFRSAGAGGGKGTS